MRAFFTDYHNRAIKTAVYSNKGSGDLVYPVLGLVDEIGEVIEKYEFLFISPTEDNLMGIIGELGDVAWYLNATVYEMDCLINNVLESFTDLMYENRVPDQYTIIHPYNSIIRKLVINSAKMAGVVKKGIRDNGGKVPLNKIANLTSALTYVSTWFQHLIHWTNIEFGKKLQMLTSVESVLEYNINKLESRQSRGVLKGDGDNR